MIACKTGASLGYFVTAIKCPDNYKIGKHCASISIDQYNKIVIAGSIAAFQNQQMQSRATIK